MTRPALSALRAIEIIDFMSQAPSQAYTLSELVRYTGTNVASLHAILNVLMHRGYLLRHPAHKTYRLSPALAAIGEAVAASEPILGHARAGAELLASRTGLEVTVVARTGDDAICLSRAGNPAVRTSMRIGQRVTLTPPFGATYYAWAEPEEVEAWIARGEDTAPERARAALEIVRERGFLITVKSPAQSEVKRALAAREGSPRGTAERQVAKALKALERGLYQPETVELDGLYEVDLMTAPIFDHTHQATYSMSLHGFSGPLSGREVFRLAGSMMEACADVMRDSDVHPERRRA